MSKNTEIKWYDHAWSPWTGSPRVLAKNWQEPLNWNRIAGWGTCDCCKSTRDASSTGNCKRCGEFNRTFTRPLVFPSLCDWLDDEVPIEWLAEFIGLISATPNLDWLLLTKRPELWRERMERVTAYNAAEPWTEKDCDIRGMASDWVEHGLAPSNVWIGVSVEDQQRADERIPALIKIPAKLRFLSVEPMIGPVDLGLSPAVRCRHCDNYVGGHATGGLDICDCRIHWVIIGGESSPDARPCNVAWIRDIVRQCRSAGVPVFVKQLGAHMVQSLDDQCIIPAYFRVALKHPKGGDLAEWPEDLRVRQMPGVKP